MISKFVHIPWTLGITGVGLGLHYLNVPVEFIAATGGLLFCLTREETQREYQIIETLHPPLRAGLKPWEAFKFWKWNRHSIDETVIATVAGYGAATAVWFLK